MGICLVRHGLLHEAGQGQALPEGRQDGPYAYANEVSRVRGKVVSKYVGIVKIPEGTEDTNVVEKGGEPDADQSGESE